jgi:hypothetical protein
MNLSITEAQREWILAWVIERLNLLKSLNNPQHAGVIECFEDLRKKLEKLCPKTNQNPNLHRRDYFSRYESGLLAGPGWAVEFSRN